MVCAKCISEQSVCQLERDWIVMLNAEAQIVFLAPTTNGLETWVGRRIDELVMPDDGAYVWNCARQTLDHRQSARWLMRDAWDRRTWLAHAEPVGGVDTGDRFAVATLRPVCHMLFTLSVRQRTILRALRRTSCTKKVASELGIREGTIRSHLSRAQSATRCMDLTELIRWSNDMQHALAIEDEVAAYLARRQR